MIKRLILSIILIVFILFQVKSQCVSSLRSYPIGSTSLRLIPTMSAQNIMAISAYLNGVNPVMSVSGDMISTDFLVSNPLTYEQVNGAILAACPELECIFRVDSLTESVITIFPEVQTDVFNQLLLVAPYDDAAISISGYFSYFQYTNPLTPEQKSQIEAIICPAPIPTMGLWGIIALSLLLCIFGVLLLQRKTELHLIDLVK